MLLQLVARDSLRRTLDSVFATKPYRWDTEPNPLIVLDRWWEQLKQWVQGLDERCPKCFDVFSLLLVVILVAILVHVVWIFVHTLRATRTRDASIGPGLVGRDQHWYRREADRLAAEGRYVEAMQAEFLALVLALDAAKVLRFHPSKTPAEYLAESALPQGAREEFRELVKALYGYAFARWPCDADAYAIWRGRAAPGRYATTP